MKRAALILLTLSIGAAAAAQEQTGQPRPDYSRQKLIQLFADEPKHEKAQPRVQLGFGSVNFKALNMRWRIAYLPILMPLSGSIPWRNNGAFGSLPNPFELTGTEIASPPRTWRRTRDMSAELKRIERSERVKARARVTVKPE